MALKEKVEFEDLILYEVLRNPVLCTEFINNVDLTSFDEPFELVWYQKEILCDFNSYVDICTARAVGKTLSLVSIITWVLIFNLYPTHYILYTVPSKVHLQPVWDGLTRQLKINSFLKNFINLGSGINSSDYSIKLNNGSQLLCRIAGQSGDGRNLIGLHTPLIICDEAGYYPNMAFNEMQPALNSWMSGFRELVSGVPTGLRENNVLYIADQENSSYTKHRVSALDNPRFTKDAYQQALDQYGGEKSDDFIHYVLGQHGSPIFALFDRRLFDIDGYPVYKLNLDGLKLSGGIEEYITKLSLIPQPPKNQGIIFGIDLGYTEPTAIFILYLDSTGRIKFHAKVQLNKVSYSIQDKVIDWLDTKFRPSLLGIDEGSAGKAVVQRLHEDVDFIHKNYKKRLIPINFSSWIVIGLDENGDEIKTKAKPLAVTILQEYSNNQKLVYSSTDQETITELERMTYTKNPSGDISYRTLTQRGGKKGEDHFTSALLCAMLAYYLENESLNPRKMEIKLIKASWFR